MPASDRPDHPALIVIAGPTAVGKTAAAIAVARRFGGEIVSADSRQIYRGMDIGTAKPTPEERAAAPHHLLDIRDPDQDFSLADYAAAARTTIADIQARARVPILTGGTPLYVNAIVEGWRMPQVPPDPALRAALEAEAARDGLALLETRLAAVDPLAAARAVGNLRRIVRALEVYELTGIPMSTLQGKEPPDYPILRTVLGLARPVLHARADARVDRMLAAGLVAEVRALLDRGHRQIAFVGSRLVADVNFRQRRDGYLRALGEQALPVHFAGDTEALAVALPKLLAAEPRITALLGCNDVFAVEAANVARAHGYRIPHDLSIMGFDDIELGRQMSPPLTTMAVDKISMGRLAVQALTYRLAWPEASPILTTLQPRLLERQSVRQRKP